MTVILLSNFSILKSHEELYEDVVLEAIPDSSDLDDGHYLGVETFRNYSIGEDPGFYSHHLYTSSNWNSRVVEEHYGHKKVLFMDVLSPTNYWESFNFVSAGTGVVEMYTMIADANAPIIFKISNMTDFDSSMSELFWYSNIGKWEQRASWDNIPDIVANQVYISDYEWFIPKFTYNSTEGGTWTFSLTYGPNLENTAILSNVTNVDALLGDVIQISVQNAWSMGADTWIDSVSYDWGVGNNYSEGDLLTIDTSGAESPIFLEIPDDFSTKKGYSGLNVSWTATDSYPTYYTIEQNGSEVISTTSWINGTAIYYTIPDGWLEGVYNITIIVMDDNGNTAQDTVIFTVADENRPVFTFTPDDSSVSEGYSGLSVSWIATDSYPNSYTIELNGTEVITATSWINGTAIYYTIPDGWLEGVYNITIIVMDASGNFAQDTTIFTINSNTGYNLDIPGFPIFPLIAIISFAVAFNANQMIKQRRRGYSN